MGGGEGAVSGSTSRGKIERVIHSFLSSSRTEEEHAAKVSAVFHGYGKVPAFALQSTEGKDSPHTSAHSLVPPTLSLPPPVTPATPLPVVPNLLPFSPPLSTSPSASSSSSSESSRAHLLPFSNVHGSSLSVPPPPL